MPCHKPLEAVRLDDGSIKFNPRSGEGDPLKLPCGQCLGCRIDRSRMWMVRCLHEASLYEDNCFITLTYDPDKYPTTGSLDYVHFQKFMRRLRKNFPNTEIRFYMCGEYGEKHKRAHFHAILFNLDFKDTYQRGLTKTGQPDLDSPTLSRIWGLGRTSVGPANQDTIGYVARYITTKISGRSQDINPNTGLRYDASYDRFDPETGEFLYKVKAEFNRMSLKPGIGQKWFDQYYADIYPEDSVRLRDGRRIKPPRFYDTKYDSIDPDGFEAIKQDRILKALKNAEEATPERLAIKAEVLKARMSKHNRTLGQL